MTQEPKQGDGWIGEAPGRALGPPAKLFLHEPPAITFQINATNQRAGVSLPCRPPWGSKTNQIVELPRPLASLTGWTGRCPCGRPGRAATRVAADGHSAARGHTGCLHGRVAGPARLQSSGRTVILPFAVPSVIILGPAAQADLFLIHHQLWPSRAGPRTGSFAPNVGMTLISYTGARKQNIKLWRNFSANICSALRLSWLYFSLKTFACTIMMKKYTLTFK